MKQDIHPEYREVIFLDMSSGKKFLCRSTVRTSEEVEFEGKKYPCMKISISSDSHPFYTGDQTFVDTEGRVDKFKKRYERKGASEEKKEVVLDLKKEEKDPNEEKEKKQASKKVAEEKAPAAKKAPASKKDSAPKEKKADAKKSGAKEAGK